MDYIPQNRRPPGKVEYKRVNYEDKLYIVGILYYKNEPITFIFDNDYYKDVSMRAWHLASTNYISSCVSIDGKRKEIYLHNLVMNNPTFPGKGAKFTVDHINRNGLDNRRENLRVITQSLQNLNQALRSRYVSLPKDSNISIDDIPKHIWYIKSNGSHGDRFAIEFKTENIIWKTTSSKSISLKEKLEDAKKQLHVFYNKYPYLDPDNIDTLEIKNKLNYSFNEIIKLSTSVECIPIDEKRLIEKKGRQLLQQLTIIKNKENELIEQIKIFNIEYPDIFKKINEPTTKDMINIKEPILENTIIEPIEETKTKIIMEKYIQPSSPSIEPVPKQWKVKQIYEHYLKDNLQPYKDWCESTHELTDMVWAQFTDALKDKLNAEKIIRDFVLSLRKLRHNKMVEATNHANYPLERENRQQWPAISVLRAYKEDKIDLFKKFQEDYTGDMPDDVKWIGRWQGFVSSLESATDEERKKLISKFMTAQRTRVYRKKASPL